MKKIIRLPGLIDIHVHLREPGATQKEDFYHGSLAALAGGITTVIDMPNNPSPTTSIKSLKKKISLAKKKSLCNCFFYLGANQTNWRRHHLINNPLLKGLKIYLDHTTGPLLVKDLAVLKKHFQFWPKKLPILVHAEGSSILKAIQLATIYKKRLHLCHLSSAEELDIIRWAKKQGLPISCEVTPHHLFLNQEDEKKLGSLVLVKPSLKSKKDNEILWQGIRNGLIDCLASDHAPHTLREKQSLTPPSGVPGLETMLPLMLTAVWQKRLTLTRLIKLLFLNPARIFNIKRNDDYVEIDPYQEWTIENNTLKTKCGWSPFAGWQVKGKIIKTICHGKNFS